MVTSTVREKERASRGLEGEQTIGDLSTLGYRRVGVSASPNSVLPATPATPATGRGLP